MDIRVKLEGFKAPRVTENTPLLSSPGTFTCRVASSGTALSVHSGGADIVAVLAAQIAILKKQLGLD